MFEITWLVAGAVAADEVAGTVAAADEVVVVGKFVAADEVVAAIVVAVEDVCPNTRLSKHHKHEIKIRIALWRARKSIH